MDFIKKNLRAILGAFFLLLFVLLIVLLKTVDVEIDPATGKEIGLSSLNFKVRDAIGTNMSWYDVTEYLGYFSIAFAAAFAGWAAVRLILSRFSLRKMGLDFLVLGCLYAAVVLFYVFFEIVVVNYRPILLESTTPEASFPSSHTFLSITVLSSAPIILHRRFCEKVSPLLFSIPFWGVSAFAAVGRLLSGVHWLTDIVGGVLLAIALVLLFAFASNLVSVKTEEAEKDEKAPLSEE